MQISVFLDHANLGHRPYRTLDVITSALMLLPLDTLETAGRCEVRIYGGWYEGASLTALAQQLIAEVESNFPTLIKVPAASGDICSITTQASLAFSLSAEPGFHLLDTFRRKRIPYNVKCIDPATLGCAVVECPLAGLPKLWNSGRCPKLGCNLELHDVIFRSEQKLVDSMLTCDVIHAAGQFNDWLVVVSGDDDLLPAIRTALLRGIPVLRVHPQPVIKEANFPAGAARLIERAL